MTRLIAAAAVIALTSGVAVAAPKKKPPKPPTVSELVLRAFQDALVKSETAPRFAFALAEIWTGPAPDEFRTDFEMGVGVLKSTVGLAADGNAAWVAADLGAYEACGDETCVDPRPPDYSYHGTMVLEAGAIWRPLVWAVDEPLTAKAQGDAMKKGGVAPDPITRVVAKGAEDVVALFEGSIADPKALAKTVSTRPEVVLYGSEMKERYAGGKKVAAQLLKWNLGFKVRDGLDAGVTASGSVAWVAANLDATSLKKKGAKATPYRALFVYTKADGRWQLVVAHFGFVP